MRACIYVRTCRDERQHNTTSAENQIAFCRELARHGNLTVADAHVFTDLEQRGDLLPTCWAPEGDDSRPALSALVSAVEEGRVAWVLVRRFDKLGTSSEVLEALLELFKVHDVRILATQEQIDGTDDPRGRFALSILRPRVHVASPFEPERKDRERARKVEEIGRLRARIARLEEEIGRA